ELGNPSAVHGFGRATRRIVEESREQIAEVLGAEPAEVILTSGGTEADNLAVLGHWEAEAAQHGGEPPGLVVSAVEHPAVLESAHHLADHRGAPLHVAPVTGGGLVDLAALADHLDAAARAGMRTALCSVMWANNETGALQPLADVIALAADHGLPVHSDAVQ